MQLAVTLRDGSETQVEAETGMTLMEALRDGGVDEIMALCGGCCSCATCHVYIEHYEGTLPSMSDIENELLDATPHREPTSRLSCQVPVDRLPPDVRIVIAPED